MPRYEGLGKLAAFTVFATVLAFALAVAGAELDVPWPVIALVTFAALFVAAWVLRHGESGHWNFAVRRYAADVDGRRVELAFDERLIILNRLTLEVEGKPVERASIFYGRKTLSSGTGDPEVSVEVGSGWVGTCTGAIARSAGSERPMTAVGSTA